MRSTPYKVLIVDDDPSHLEIYGLLLAQAGYEPVSALVRFNGAEFPPDPAVNAIILDSRLNSMKSPSDLARQIRSRYPHAPIVLLTDVNGPAPDIQPYLAGFVGRGDPAALLSELARLSGQSAGESQVLAYGAAS